MWFFSELLIHGILSGSVYALISLAFVYMANLPPEANVLFMTIMATQMPFVGRG